MIKTFLLTIVFLKNSLQRVQSKYYENAKKNKKTKRILYIILFVYLAAVIGVLSYNIIDLLQQSNQESIFIGIILFIVLVITIIQTIFSSINLLYYTKDTEAILPLPLKPYQIICARTNVILIVEYFVEIIVGGIPLVVYGWMMNCNALYYFSIAIALILLPILPVILVSILVMILMSFSKITKNRNKFQLFITLLVVAITIAFSVAISRVESNTISEEQLVQMMSQANSMIDLMDGYLPTLDYSIDAILSNNIGIMCIEFLKVIGITIIVFILYLALSQKLYFKGLIGNLYSGTSKKKNKKVKIKNKSIGKMYVEKEFKILLRNPVYLVQCIIPAIIFPILCIALIVISIDEESLKQILALLESVNADGVIMLVILGIIEFFSMLVYISVTAISRDGKNAIFMKYIPIPLYKQYVYKTIPNIIMNLFPILIVMVLAKYLVDISILDLAIIFVVAIIMNIAQSFLLLIVDLKRPKLQWDSEYTVVKQNLNLIFPMVFGIFGIVILILYAKTTQILSVYIILAMIAVIYLLIAILANVYLYKRQNELASKIE